LAGEVEKKSGGRFAHLLLQLNTLALVLNELKRDPIGAQAKSAEVIKKALADTNAARDETG